MALNASGPISIGGTTAGQSINLELGRAATATSNLNESDLRTLAGVLSGTISLSNFYGKSNGIDVSWFLEGNRYSTLGNNSYYIFRKYTHATDTVAVTGTYTTPTNWENRPAINNVSSNTKGYLITHVLLNYVTFSTGTVTITSVPTNNWIYSVGSTGITDFYGIASKKSASYNNTSGHWLGGEDVGAKSTQPFNTQSKLLFSNDTAYHTTSSLPAAGYYMAGWQSTTIGYWSVFSNRSNYFNYQAKMTLSNETIAYSTLTPSTNVVLSTWGAAQFTAGVPLALGAITYRDTVSDQTTAMWTMGNVTESGGNFVWQNSMRKFLYSNDTFSTITATIPQPYNSESVSNLSSGKTTAVGRGSYYYNNVGFYGVLTWATIGNKFTYSNETTANSAFSLSAPTNGNALPLATPLYQK